MKPPLSKPHIPWEVMFRIPQMNIPFTKVFSRFTLELASLPFLVAISIVSFAIFYANGLALAYNDARSHLDIARRVVEGLKTGAAQLGSVWLPLPHIVMLPTIWNDFFWHSGLAGALPNMIFFVATALMVVRYLRLLDVSLIGRLVALVVFVANINILYLQSTAMTEVLLIAMMTASTLEFLLWVKSGFKVKHLVLMSFFVMLSTLTRYDGWFLCAYICACMLLILAISRRKWSEIEGTFLMYCTLAGFGIVLWLGWNLVIFKDPLYFAFGPFSAHAQQEQLDSAGVLVTKKNLVESIRVYAYALFYNSNAYLTLLSFLGAFFLWSEKKLPLVYRIATTALIAPLLFNILALYLGHSVLFIQGISGDTWFNVRYGIMLHASVAIFIGYLIHKARDFRLVLIATMLFVLFFQFARVDAVTIDDARVGSSQKNVSEVSGYLKKHATNAKGFILISAASHDAIIFSSGLPMKRFIHEGTGAYWDAAIRYPDRWARWIVVRTYDDNDLTWKSIKDSPGLVNYRKVANYPFADVYELDAKLLPNLITEPILRQRK
jgi:hypothetical protein